MMLIKRAMPCLLVEENRLVKSVRFKSPIYVGDPVNAIKIYNEKEVDELIVLDIVASKKGRPVDFEFAAQIAEECFMPLCYGGGVRDVESAGRLFSIGVEKVAVNAAARARPQLVRELSAAFGSQSVVMSVDVKKNLLGFWRIYDHVSGKTVREDPVEFAKRMQDEGAGEILLASVDRDGTWAGYDLALLKAVTSALDIPVIACGGAGSTADMGKAVVEGGASGAAVGSMAVFSGKGLGVLVNFPGPDELRAVMPGR